MNLRVCRRPAFIAAAILFVLLIWYTCCSLPPNISIGRSMEKDVTYVSFFAEDGVFGENNILLQTRTEDPDLIQDIMDCFKQGYFYYDLGGSKGGVGETMLIMVGYADKPTVTWQLKKSKNGSITIEYEGKKYFLEYFSEKKELLLYQSLFQSASEISSESNYSAPSASTSDIPTSCDSSQSTDSSSKATNTASDTADSESEKPTATPPTDKKMIEEMTVLIVNEAGEPVPNIGIYVNPRAGKPLHKSTSYAISAQDGIAVLQRIRTGFEQSNSIEIGLCDRNQSNQAMQLSSETIPDKNTDLLTLVWSGEPPVQYEAKSTNRFVLQLLTPDGLPVCDAWFSISRSSNGPDRSDGDMTNPEVIPEGVDLSMLDRDRSTDKDGNVVFTNLPECEYSITVYLGKPPFSNVASEHPRLQQKFKMQRYKVQHILENSDTTKLIFTG